MGRAKADDVRSIIDTDTTVNMAPFLKAAEVVVARVETCATNKGYTLTTDELTMLETYLAAHYYAVKDPAYLSKKTLDASATFQRSNGKGYESTSWGQAALDFDPSGCLAALSKRVRPKVYWMGKPPSEQTDYVDRD